MKLRTKLFAGFLIAAVIAAVIGSIGIKYIKQIDDLDTKLYQKVVVPLADLGTISVSFQKIRINLRDAVEAKDEKERLVYSENIKKLREIITVRADDFEKSILTEEDTTLFKEFKKTHHVYGDLIARILELDADKKDAEALSLIYGDAKKTALQEQELLNSLMESKEAQGKLVSDVNSAEANRAATILIGFTAVSFLFAFGLGWAISQKVLNELGADPSDLHKIAEAVADGDLSVIGSLDGDEKQKSVLRALQVMTLRLQELMSQKDSALEYAENIVETVREPMLVLDSDLKIISANHSFYETFAVNPADTIAQHLYDLGDGQWNIPALRLLLEQILPNNSVINGYEVEHDFPGIGLKTMLLNARQVFREAVGSNIILLAMEDVTERMAAEDKLQSAMEEITVQIEELQDQQIELELQTDELQLANNAKDKLNAKANDALILLNAQKLELDESNRLLVASSQTKSIFMANMSHELRTPLNSIIGFSDVLQDKLYGELSEMQSDCVDDIISSGKHLLSLINDILDITKVESGKMELQSGIFSLRDILDNAHGMLILKAQKAEICLSMELSPQADISIEADQRKLKQILYNLLSNAVKFTPLGGTVSVVVEREGDYIKISVVDSGMGIREEDIPKLFQPFTQLVTADNTFGGTGLGLALTKQLVELHGGRVWLTSRFGSGSTFGFTIPLTQSGVDEL